MIDISEEMKDGLKTLSAVLSKPQATICKEALQKTLEENESLITNFKEFQRSQGVVE